MLAVLSSARKQEARRFLLFGLSGLPVFALALGLNILLIEFANWPKPVAYLLVIWMQMTLGFLISHFLIFRTAGRRPWLSAYLQWALSMGVIRVADWVSYTVLVEVVRVPYVFAQLSTSLVFILVKFLSARYIFRSQHRSSTENRSK